MRFCKWFDFDLIMEIVRRKVLGVVVWMKLLEVKELILIGGLMIGVLNVLVVLIFGLNERVDLKVVCRIGLLVLNL